MCPEISRKGNSVFKWRFGDTKRIFRQGDQGEKFGLFKIPRRKSPKFVSKWGFGIKWVHRVLPKFGAVGFFPSQVSQLFCHKPPLGFQFGARWCSFSSLGCPKFAKKSPWRPIKAVWVPSSWMCAPKVLFPINPFVLQYGPVWVPFPSLVFPGFFPINTLGFQIKGRWGSLFLPRVFVPKLFQINPLAFKFGPWVPFPSWFSPNCFQMKPPWPSNLSRLGSFPS